MDIKALSVLLQVTRLGSFASAARAMDVDPSSVSRTVAGIEAELGLRLFERSTRRLVLTEAGKLYVARIEPLVEELERAHDEAAINRQSSTGRVRLTASIAFGHEMLVPMLPVFQEHIPDVEVEFVLSDDPVDLIGSRIDLAIRLAPSPSGDLISARLMNTRYHVVAAPDYIANAPVIRIPKDLEQHKCLRYVQPNLRDVWRFKNDDDTCEVQIDGRVLISNALALRQAARAGSGPALLADWLIRDDLVQGALIDLLPDWRVTATKFETGAWLLYPSRTYLPARTRAVIDLIRENIAKM